MTSKAKEGTVEPQVEDAVEVSHPEDEHYEMAMESHEVQAPALASAHAVTTADSVEEMERRFGFAKKIAQLMADSALVPKDFRGSPANCFIAIQMGAELGLGPFQSVQSIAVVNGRPSVWGDALLGLVRASGKLAYIREWTEKSDDGKGDVAYCEVMRRGDKQPVVRTFSLQDAARADLLSKPIWKSYPTRMLQMRARAYALRDTFADVMKGISVAEEMQDSVYFDQSPASPPPHLSSDEGTGASRTQEPEPEGGEATSAPGEAYDALSEALMGAKSIQALLKLKARVRDFPDPEEREVLQRLYNQRRDEVKK